MQDLQDKDLFRQQALIGGTWRDAASGSVLDVTNPADGSVLGQVPLMSHAETEEAIATAEAAFAKFKTTTAGERAALLERWFTLIHDHGEDLARIMTFEQGKPLAEARGEVTYAASFVKWFAEEARRTQGSTLPAPSKDRRIMVWKEPVGVCAIITPWNFPAAMITRKIAPAIAAGCSVVIKPSEFTPYTALALAELAERAGIPAGVVNVVTGMPQEVGPALTGTDAVRKISFTGSTRVGSLLMREASSSIKRLSLELGGNAPFIVFDDADLDKAVEGVLASKFRNGGQTCVCANRIFVQDGIYEAFAEKLAAKVAAMRVGPGLTEGTTIGPMINQAAVDKIETHISDALSKGAKVVGRRPVAPNEGTYVAPVVLGEATTEMLLASEETFGPVAPLFRFDTDAEAIALANATPFGLASYFFTENLTRAFRVGEALEFGMVGLNTGNIATELAPFGGVKQSGLGREGGREGIEEYLEAKSFHIGGL